MEKNKKTLLLAKQSFYFLVSKLILDLYKTGPHSVATWCYKIMMMKVLQENPFVGRTNFLLLGQQRVSQALKKLPNFLHLNLTEKLMKEKEFWKLVIMCSTKKEN